MNDRGERYAAIAVTLRESEPPTDAKRRAVNMDDVALLEELVVERMQRAEIGGVRLPDDEIRNLWRSEHVQRVELLRAKIVRLLTI